MARQIGVQSLDDSYQKLKKWYLIPPCLTLNIIRYVSRVKWSKPGKGVAPSPTLRWSSYWKGIFRVALDYCRQLYLFTIPKAPVTIGVTVTFMFHSFSNSLARSRYLSFFSYSFSFILWSAGTAKSTILQILFLLLLLLLLYYYLQFCKFSFFYWLLLGLVFWLRLSNPSVCQSPTGVYVSHFFGQMLGFAFTICSYGQI